jgi:hypothetical protein
MRNNLTTQKPRSPKERYEGIISLPRFFDKLRAKSSNTLGEYMVGPDSALDKGIIEFLTVDFDTLLKFVTPEKTDEEIFSFVKENFKVPNLEDCNVWSDKIENMRLLDDPSRQAYAQIVIEKMNLPEDVTTLDWLILGDK